MAATWPNVVTYLVATLPTLPGWSQVSVFDGPPLTADDPTDYATVGYIEDDHGGTFTQIRAEDGFTVDEAGEVRCQLVCQSGDTELAPLRTRAFGLSDALDDHLRKDQTLGEVLSQNGTAVLTVAVLSIQANGAAQALQLTVHYASNTFTA